MSLKGKECVWKTVGAAGSFPPTCPAACLSVSFTYGGKGSLVFVLTRHLWGLIDVCGRGGSIMYQSTVIRKQDVMIGGVSSLWRQLAQPTKAHTHTQKNPAERNQCSSADVAHLGLF